MVVDGRCLMIASMLTQRTLLSVCASSRLSGVHVCMWQNMRGAESVVAAALRQANLTLNKHKKHKKLHTKGNLVCGLCEDVNLQHYHKSKDKMHVAHDEAARLHSNVTHAGGSSLVCPLNSTRLREDDFSYTINNI